MLVQANQKKLLRKKNTLSKFDNASIAIKYAVASPLQNKAQ